MKNTASETCEAVTKDLMFVSLLLERNKRGNGIEIEKKKKLEETVAENFPDLANNMNLQICEAEQNSKENELNKIHTKIQNS